MKLVFTILFSVLFSFFMKSQKLSSYEKCWAIQHPFAAIKVKQISKNCFKMYTKIQLSKQLDTFSNGGTLDAFRHVFFMAAFAQKIKEKKLNKLGIAHEKGNYKQFLKNKLENGELPDSIATVMDLKNNALGFFIAQKHKTKSLEELAQVVIVAIKNGEALIVKRNKAGSYIDCNGNIIVFTTKKWVTAKCLVASNN